MEPHAPRSALSSWVGHCSRRHCCAVLVSCVIMAHRREHKVVCVRVADVQQGA
jgi:hypothetical protein